MSQMMVHVLIQMTITFEILKSYRGFFHWLVSEKTRKVCDQNDIRLITRSCERNILQRHEKCQVYDFGDSATGPDEAKY